MPQSIRVGWVAEQNLWLWSTQLKKGLHWQVSYSIVWSTIVLCNYCNSKERAMSGKIPLTVVSKNCVSKQRNCRQYLWACINEWTHCIQSRHSNLILKELCQSVDGYNNINIFISLLGDNALMVFVFSCSMIR